MPPVRVDIRLMQLASLDVIDVGFDGAPVLNDRFVQQCRRAFRADPSIIDTVIGANIGARAAARGMSGEIDLQALILAALDVGST